MGLSLSHSSYQSSRDENGFHHFFSIDPLTCERGRHATSYKAKAKSNGGLKDFKDGSIMTVVFTENYMTVSSDVWAKTEVEKSTMAEQIAQKFNAVLPHLGQGKTGFKKINFPIPQTAQLCDVCSIKTARPKRRENETFLAVQTFSRPTTFLHAHGSTGHPKAGRNGVGFSLRRSQSLCPQQYDYSAIPQGLVFRRRANSQGVEVGSVVGLGSYNDSSLFANVHSPGMPWYVPHAELQSFVHYAFLAYGGELAFDKLEGECDEDSGYRLKTPVIHTRDGRFGQGDKGIAGIQRVIENHVCCHLCAHLPAMAITMTVTHATPQQRSVRFPG